MRKKISILLSMVIILSFVPLGNIEAYYMYDYRIYLNMSNEGYYGNAEYYVYTDTGISGYLDISEVMEAYDSTLIKIAMYKREEYMAGNKIGDIIIEKISQDKNGIFQFELPAEKVKQIYDTYNASKFILECSANVDNNEIANAYFTIDIKIPIKKFYCNRPEFTLMAGVGTTVSRGDWITYYYEGNDWPNGKFEYVYETKVEVINDAESPDAFSVIKTSNGDYCIESKEQAHAKAVVYYNDFLDNNNQKYLECDLTAVDVTCSVQIRSLDNSNSICPGNKKSLEAILDLEYIYKEIVVDYNEQNDNKYIFEWKKPTGSSADYIIEQDKDNPLKCTITAGTKNELYSSIPIEFNVYSESNGKRVKVLSEEYSFIVQDNLYYVGFEMPHNINYGDTFTINPFVKLFSNGREQIIPQEQITYCVANYDDNIYTINENGTITIKINDIHSVQFIIYAESVDSNDVLQFSCCSDYFLDFGLERSKCKVYFSKDNYCSEEDNVEVFLNTSLCNMEKFSLIINFYPCDIWGYADKTVNLNDELNYSLVDSEKNKKFIFSKKDFDRVLEGNDENYISIEAIVMDGDKEIYNTSSVVGFEEEKPDLFETNSLFVGQIFENPLIAIGNYNDKKIAYKIKSAKVISQTPNDSNSTVLDVTVINDILKIQGLALGEATIEFEIEYYEGRRKIVKKLVEDFEVFNDIHNFDICSSTKKSDFLVGSETLIYSCGMKSGCDSSGEEKNTICETGFDARILIADYGVNVEIISKDGCKYLKVGDYSYTGKFRVEYNIIDNDCGIEETIVKTYNVVDCLIETDNKNFACEGINLSINPEDEISLNIHFALEKELINHLYLRMKFLDDNSSWYKYGFNETTNDSSDGLSRIVYSIEMNAAEMARQVRFELVDIEDNNVLYSNTISVKQYAEKLLTDQSAQNAKWKPLVKSMLNYGTAVQNYFGKYTDVLANDILSDSDKLVQEMPKNAIDIYNKKIDISIAGMKYIGTSLVLNDMIHMRHYFSLPENRELGEYRFGLQTHDDYQFIYNEIKPIKCGNLYYVEMPYVSPLHYGDASRLKIADGACSKILGYNVNNYLGKALSNDNISDDFEILLNAIYWYGVEAQKVA